MMTILLTVTYKQITHSKLLKYLEIRHQKKMNASETRKLYTELKLEGRECEDLLPSEAEKPSKQESKPHNV